jgi:hypothetical protein
MNNKEREVMSNNILEGISKFGIYLTKGQRLYIEYIDEYHFGKIVHIWERTSTREQAESLLRQIDESLVM